MDLNFFDKSFLEKHSFDFNSLKWIDFKKSYFSTTDAFYPEKTVLHKDLEDGFYIMQEIDTFRPHQFIYGWFEVRNKKLVTTKFRLNHKLIKFAKVSD